MNPNPDDPKPLPTDVHFFVALGIFVPFAAAHLLFPLELDLYSPVTFGLLVGTTLLLRLAVEQLPYRLRWHAERPVNGRITLRRLHQAISIDARDFVTLEYGALGARAVLDDGRRILLADDESAALLLGLALMLDEHRKPGGPYRAA